MTDEPKPGQWDYWGACDPLRGGSFHGMGNFSLGCFQWVARKNGKGVKKGPVAWRFAGPIWQAEDVHRRARAFCDMKNEQERHRAALAAEGGTDD